MAERPEDLNLPSAVVSRIIKDALPSQAKVSKEASAAIAKAASVFVLYATSCANNVATGANRKTIAGNDVIQAMADMEFDKFVKPLENSLDIWKQGQKNKKETAAKRKKDAEKDTTSPKKPKGDDADDDDDVVEVDQDVVEVESENKENEDDDEVQEVSD